MPNAKYCSWMPSEFIRSGVVVASSYNPDGSKGIGIAPK